MAPSPSGKAVACKATIPSSNLGGASIKLTLLLLSGDVGAVERAGLENR